MLPTGERKNVFLHLEESCLAALGRRLLLWWPKSDSDGRVLTLVDPLEGRDLWPERKFSAAARAAVVGEEAVGVFDPDGRFVLLGLPDGRTIADVKLDAQPNLLDIILLTSKGQYFLITRSATDPTASIQPLPGCAVKPIYARAALRLGRAGQASMAQARRVGKPISLAGPAGASADFVFRHAAHSPRYPMARTTRRCLCCASTNAAAAIVCNQDVPLYAGLLDVTGDAEKKTVDLVMQRSIVRLTFTDKPWPPPSATDGQPADSPQRHARRGRSVELDAEDARPPARRGRPKDSRGARNRQARAEFPAEGAQPDEPRQAASGVKAFSE